MSRQLVVLGAVLVVLASACGGKKSAAPPPTTTAAASPTTTAASTPTTTAAMTTTSSSSGTPTFASTKNCLQLKALATKVAQSISPSTAATDPGKFAQLIEAMASAAPGDIKPDFKTFADAYSSFVKAYTSSGYKLGSGTTPTATQIAKLTAAAQLLSTPKVKAAVQHLSAWGQKNCGIG